MSTRRGGLGKGLGALIPTGPVTPVAGGSTFTHSALAPAYGISATGLADAGPQLYEGPGAVPGASFREIPVDQIRPNAKQPRQVFDQEALAELASSIEAFGMLQPVVVRETGPATYELVMGERRWRAAAEAGFDRIPAIVRDTTDDAMLRNALLENLHRQQLNPLEEAAAYQQLLEEFGATHEELARRIRRSRSQVTNTIRLLNLPLPVQRRVAAGVLSAGHARALLGLDDADQQDALATRIVAEGLSVRATEELVSLMLAGHGPRAGKPRAAQAARVVAPGLSELADRLSDSFDTRVKVELGRHKGKIVVEFASVDDLERIVSLMAPAIAQGAGGTAIGSEERSAGAG
ncbi:MAG: ParB/RepB/Spo0J family partition protein [Actinobacteria bacterium]|nr:ParB/RepB/Spo0J family partition protein [Actinomycetota bacterium]MBI3687361.1 ParB/RepB/Spo0J family partition protein [Actinomycetota bacterium]